MKNSNPILYVLTTLFFAIVIGQLVGTIAMTMLPFGEYNGIITLILCFFVGLKSGDVVNYITSDKDTKDKQDLESEQ